MLSATLLTYSSLFGLRLQNLVTDQVTEPGILVRIMNKAYGVRLRSLQAVLALAAGPATLQFPSAMTLYWISSGLCAIGSKLLLIWWMPWEDKAAPTKRTLTSAKQQSRGPTMQKLRIQNDKKKQKPKN